ncbi:serine/threonine-protein kinase [Mycolicibacterium madagascariense]
MGEVYEAFDNDKGRAVALKILPDQFSDDERFRERFSRESRSAAILQEPHVVPIHDWGEIDGRLFIDMRLIRGQTLQELTRTGPLEPDRAVSIIEQVAAALDAAHAEGLIHRDVKPQNIIVTSAGFAYLVDFGIAEAMGDSRLTMDGTQIGSLAYMAPERFSDERCTSAVDVYSLACVLYEALTGDNPFPADSYERLIAGHITAAPPRPSVGNRRVPLAMDGVIARGMAKEPDDRYGSAGALGRAAQRALQANTLGDVDPDSDTTERPRESAAEGDNAANMPSSGSGNGASSPSETSTASGSRFGLVPLAVIGVTCALLLGAIGVVVGILVTRNTAQNTTSAPPLSVASSSASVSLPPAYQSVSAPVPTVTSTMTTPPPLDPEASGYQQLRQIADADHPFVATSVAERWVPQLSSKRPGVVDEGVVWGNALTLQEHLQLRQRFGARLLWSGDWSTFDAPNFWVTIVPVTFNDADGALQWCMAEGFDSNHCYAKLISSTHPVPGSTARY